MRRRRINPTLSEAELKRYYAEPHDASDFADHQARVDATISRARHVVAHDEIYTAADLSCGNGAVLNALDKGIAKFYGDYAPGYDITGPIEQTIDTIPVVDLFICGETLEHLDAPEAVLERIRLKTDHLILTTPVAPEDDDNWEHYWAWDADAVDAMLIEAGFEIVQYSEIDTRPTGGMYSFGLWWCR